MSVKKTHDEYVRELAIKNPNIEVVEQYVDSRTPIMHRCKNHNVSWNISPSNSLKGKGCKKCKGEKIHNTLVKCHNKYVEEVKQCIPHVDVLETYVNSKTPILHHCNIHNYTWRAFPYNILDGKGCIYCKIDKIKTKLAWSHQDYLDCLAIVNPNIEPLEPYINMNTKIWHRCKIDNTRWQMSPNAIIHQGCGCPKCNDKTKTHEQYIAELYDINPNIRPTETYKGSDVAIWHVCLIDGYRWKALPGHTVRGTGCPKCGGSLKYTHEEFVAKLREVNSDIDVLEQYNGGKHKIAFKCKIDGHIWKARPDGLLEGKGCPQCQESNGERTIRQWLELNHIAYVPQKTFADCRDQNMLPYDFYLSEHNILIEYDGQQHFEPVDFAGRGEEWAQRQFCITQYHDSIKNDYCKSHGICLLRIAYWQNIVEELNNFLI